MFKIQTFRKIDPSGLRSSPSRQVEFAWEVTNFPNLIKDRIIPS